MVSTVLRKMSYEGTFIYILNYGFTFQYLFAFNNEVYRQEIISAPDWFLPRRWLWKIGLVDNPYTREQLEQGERIVLSGAMKSIDELKKLRATSRKKKSKR